MKIIPFDSSISSKQNFFVNLGKNMCKFDFSWNERCKAWFVDFSTSFGFKNSVRLVENSPLLNDSDVLGIDGFFKVLKTNQSGDNLITYDNLGKDWFLIYGTREEWESLDVSLES